MKKLVFDSALTGHHSEYIRHLINFLFKTGTKGNIIYFLLHNEFKESFPEIFAKASKVDGLIWKQITQDEFEFLKTGNPIKKSLNEYKVLDSYAKKFQVDQVIAMDFHPLKYGSIFNRSHYSISSIQFLNFPRLSKNNFQQKKEYYKLYLLAKLSSLNKKVDKVFILNDEQSVNYLNKEFNTNAYRLLPDPIEQLTPAIDYDIYEHYNIPRHKKIFLHIGSLGDRKGSFQVAEAASHIPAEWKEQVAILIVGKAHIANERERLLAQVNKLRGLKDVQVIWDQQFVASSVMKSLFDQCYAVLIPYKNSEFSSGILGHAAAAKKPVLATDSGLIRILVKKYDLGVLIDEVTGEEVAGKMIKMLTNPIVPDKKSEFVENHAPQIFAKTILTD
ncbi:MAG: glycosyltransferase [Leeuwenhoekiella sp.]